MKVLAILVLCAFVAVQGRSAGDKSSVRSLAVAGENPWVVHLRVAIATSGYLNTAAGSLISERWVLTSSEGVDDARFIWIRYGAINVINPELVTEASIVQANAPLALININRIIQYTANISPVSLADKSVPSSASFVYYGVDDQGLPSEVLNAITVSISEQDDSIVVTSDEGQASANDLGTPLVSEGVQFAVLVKAGEGDVAGEFVKTEGFLSWIQETTGVELRSRAQIDDSLKVQFAN